MKKTLLSMMMLVVVVLAFAQSRSNLRSGHAPFFHGVASGDPLPTQVMLWTRVTPPTGSTADIDVYWQIATDIDFNNIVNFGKTKAVDSTDFTVKVDVCGLDPGTYYYYAFNAFGTNSITGRTKTAPVGNVSKARFGVVSCSGYEHGFFNVYKSLAEENDIDAVLHLGDYIYEYATRTYHASAVTNAGRTYEPTHEIVSLEDYRTRHSHYRLDDDLRVLHQRFPFITTWDDHESANDSYKDGAENHDPATQGPWEIRKANSVQAYSEWLPIRNPDPNNFVKIWRNFQYGNLLDLIVLDSRLWGRDEQTLTGASDPNRRMLGNDQFDWFESRLSNSSSLWKIIPQQVMMAPLEAFGVPVNSDQWDGYRADRNRFINYIENNNIRNAVVLTGDIHTSWVNNIPGNSTTRAAVEYVVTSVTSPGADFITDAFGSLVGGFLGNTAESVIRFFNSHMRYIDLTRRGYMILTVDANRAQTDYTYVSTVTSPTYTTTSGPYWFTNVGNPNVQESNTPAASQAGPPVPSTVPNLNMPFVMLKDTFEVTANENAFLSTCFINASSLCPSKTSTILVPPVFGDATVNTLCLTYDPITNYYGTDYMTIAVCDVAAPNQCDTVVIQFNIIGDNDIEVISYNIDSDSTLTDCPVYNDLVFAPVSFDFSYIGNGSFDYANGCFTYTPDFNFNGLELANIYACDSIGICDTILLQFFVSGPSTTQTIQINVNQGDLTSNCLGFDDFDGTLVSSGMTYSGNNGNAIFFNDTCFSYISNPDFVGVDTITIYGCDNSVPSICDTIIYWINVIEPNATSIISVQQEAANNDFAIIGVYPNPFDSDILIQFYQFKSEMLYFTMYDMLGKEIFRSKMGDTDTGLKYFNLDGSRLPNGQYIIEISNESHRYVKQMLKVGK
jgi:alkaline phosphatase D